MTLTLWSAQPEDSLYELFGFTKQLSYRVEQVSIRENESGRCIYRLYGQGMEGLK